VVVGRWRERSARILARLATDGGGVRFWQRGGGHDRNIVSTDELTEKLAYMHANPLKRGLAERNIDWEWSSARWYAGWRDGTVAIDPPRKPE
jgi:putative transposase